MKGVSVAAVGEPFKVVDDLTKPTPAADQILVKSLVAAVNMVETYQQSWGILVHEWPMVLGCDAGGVVVEVGSSVKKFAVGDHVCGCTRLGDKGYCTFQQLFLMDEKLTIKTPAGLTDEQAATVGVGVLTACIGLFNGLAMDYPDVSKSSPQLDDWVLVLGGASSVGQYAIQLAKIAGYKVVASCSPRTSDAVKARGADETFSYTQSEEAQLADIKRITGGKFARAIDAVAKSSSCAFLALTQGSTAPVGKKYFTSTDDWSEMAPVPGVEIHRIRLGHIGGSGKDLELYPTINEDVAGWIPKIERDLEEGRIKPLEYELVGGEAGGFENVDVAIGLVKAGKGGGKKYVVRLQQE